MKTIKRLVKINICLFIIGILGIIGLYVMAYFSPILDIRNTGQYYIYDKNNSIIYQGSGNTKWVALEDVSPYFIDAVISIEDKNFYNHNGFDYLRIIKTLIDNFTLGVCASENQKSTFTPLSVHLIAQYVHLLDQS